MQPRGRSSLLFVAENSADAQQHQHQHEEVDEDPADPHGDDLQALTQVSHARPPIAQYSSNTPREMIIFWMFEVPSTIWKDFASLSRRAAGYSLENP